MARFHGPGAGFAAFYLFALGCSLEQRAATKLVDPGLRDDGIAIAANLTDDRGEADLEIGTYRVFVERIREEPFDGTGPLAPDSAGRSRPTQQLRLKLRVEASEPWIAECVAQLQESNNPDYAAIVDEPREQVAIDCRLGSEAGDERWRFRSQGLLQDNLIGSLQRDDGAQTRQVEILIWYQLWNVTRRHLPAVLAQIRDGEQATAAMVFSVPEKAWLSKELAPSERDLSVTLLAALRFLPLAID